MNDRDQGIAATRVATPVGALSRARFTTRLGRTLEFTTLGYGSGPLGNFQRPFSESECLETVNAAWNAGIRYFDTAPFYGLGLSERRVGRVLAQKRRDDFVVSSKVGRLLEPSADGRDAEPLFVATPPVRPVFDYSYDGVMRSFEATLARTGLSRIDILYVHDVDALVHGGRAESEARIVELMERGGWRAVDALRSAGVVSAIGAGVNEWQPCVRLLELADPDLFLLAGRYTLLEHSPNETLFPKCLERGARVVVGGPYNSGVLAGRGTYNYGPIPDSVRAHVRALERVCDAHGVEMRAAALQFVVAHPAVVSVIPGAVSRAEVQGNVAAMHAPIPNALWEALKAEGLLARDVPTPVRPAAERGSIATA